MRHTTTFFAAAIIAASLALAITSYWEDSLIVDEIPHIGAGYSYLVKQDMRLNPEHPPLAKDLAAVPLLFMGLDQGVFSTKFWKDDLNGQWEFGRKLIYGSGNDATAIVHYARLPMLLFFLLSAVLVFIWARELFGDTSAILALALFAFSPTVLAHSRFVTTDVAALTGVLYAAYFFIRWLKRPSGARMAVAAVVFGLALLTKFSAFLLVPFLGLVAMAWGASRSGMTFWRNIREALRCGAAAGVVFIIGFVVVVWPAYLFHTRNYPAERQRQDTQALLASYGNRTLADAAVWISNKPVLRAAGQYALGLLMVSQRAAGGNTTYFLGHVHGRGWWYYFPVVYFLKEPLAWWILAAIALLSAKLFLRGARANTQALSRWIRQHVEIFAMLLWLAIYWAASMKSILNIGVRHLLPTYPFAIMLVAGQTGRFTEWIRARHERWFRPAGAIVALLLGWYVFESMNAYPYYLTYFNHAAGGPSGGYRYVVDSNLDWGQDLKRLASWVDGRGINRIDLDYFGWADQGYYLGEKFSWISSTTYVNAQDFLARNRSDGWIAVSATFLQGSIGDDTNPNPINYSWLTEYRPEAIIGNSIFVWHITR